MSFLYFFFLNLGSELAGGSGGEKREEGQPGRGEREEGEPPALQHHQGPRTRSIWKGKCIYQGRHTQIKIFLMVRPLRSDYPPSHHKPYIVV